MAISFSANTKAEICRTQPQKRCCALAEAFGVLLYANSFSADGIRIITESQEFAQNLPKLFKKAFSLNFDTLPEQSGIGKQIFQITDRVKLSQIMDAYGFSLTTTLSLHVNLPIVESDCCRTAFLRGAFLAGGSVTDPQKGYHLEMSTSHQSVSREMVALMRDLDLEPKDAPRKGNSVIYFKQSDRIEDFLTSIGAPISAMEVMNAKLEKDLRGSVNRRVNCDAANLDKAVEAALLQVEAIRNLEESGQLDQLPEKLKEAAQLRLEHPADTLLQLAQRCDPPITKSALNHRLRKLVELGKK